MNDLPELRDRQREIVASLQMKLIHCPHTDAALTLSYAIQGLRDLELAIAELELDQAPPEPSHSIRTFD